MKNPETIVKNILKLVSRNFSHFKMHPKQLAWMMMNYELIHRAGRSIGRCDDNPKYAVIEIGKDDEKTEIKCAQDADLVYDAWANCISNERKFPDIDQRIPNWDQTNPTLDDWVDRLTSPYYEYHSLYKDRDAVEDCILCTIGAGWGWNKDGYVDQTGPSGVGQSIFAGYTRIGPQVPAKFRNKILKWRKSEKIAEAIKEYMRAVAINWGDDEALKNYENLRFKVERTATHKTIAKRLKAFKFICYLEQLVQQALTWTDEEWQEHSHNPTWAYHGTSININEVVSGFYTSSYSYASDKWTNVDDHDHDLRINKLDYLISKRLEGIDVTGWDALKLIVATQKEWDEKRHSILYKDKTENSLKKHYPISENYSIIATFPDNAHYSYVIGAVKVLKEIIDNDEERESSREIAKRVIRRFKKDFKATIKEHGLKL